MDFTSQHVDVLSHGGEIAFVPSTATVGEAYQVLVNRNIYSIPVFDAASNSYIGLIDLVDIVAAMIDMFYAAANVHSAAELAKVVSSKWKKEAAHIRTRLMALPAAEVINKSGQNPIKLVPQGTPLSAVLSYLTNDVRRLPVVNADGKITQMVSQADVIRYIHAKHMASLDAKLKRQIGTFIHEAVDVEPDTRTLDCFAIMNELKISALPIVDRSDGSIIGVITLKDVQGGLEDLSQLFKPVEDFISYMRQQNIGTLREFPFISMHDHDTVEKAVNKMIAAKIHRVFVKKNGAAKLYVLTVKDVLQSLLH
eukprot:TRINITY_DN1525_c0_g1_i1.p1 TRINITY_DN1525_c0_g1~~TRINITY_DN1525_c0_g1_i1.p1  ORF type:complete len:310 (+),score=76.37 TRINITY_DN1525_c0_g1_i1:91-1020(+)